MLGGPGRIATASALLPSVTASCTGGERQRNSQVVVERCRCSGAGSAAASSAVVAWVARLTKPSIRRYAVTASASAAAEYSISER